MTTEAKWSDFASMDGAKMVAAANQLLPPWVSLALVIVIAWKLAAIIWSLVPGPASGDPVVAPPGPQSMAAPSSGNADAQSIVAAHLFGEADPEDAPV